MSYNITLGKKEYFKGIGKIPFEGPDSQNPIAFKYYDENQLVAGKTMRDHFRFSVAYWHTFRGTGGDPFGPGTKNFPWDTKSHVVPAIRVPGSFSSKVNCKEPIGKKASNHSIGFLVVNPLGYI